VLAQKRQAELCVFVGRYCKDHVLGHCTDHKKRYCCYGSSLERQVREGVAKQLRYGFGSARHPNCRGLPVRVLQQVDFAKLSLDVKLPEVTTPSSDKVIESVKGLNR